MSKGAAAFEHKREILFHSEDLQTYYVLLGFWDLNSGILSIALNVIDQLLYLGQKQKEDKVFSLLIDCISVDFEQVEQFDRNCSDWTITIDEFGPLPLWAANNGGRDKHFGANF